MVMSGFRISIIITSILIIITSTINSEPVECFDDFFVRIGRLEVDSITFDSVHGAALDIQLRFVYVTTTSVGLWLFDV